MFIERKNVIIEELNKNLTIKVNNLSSILGVSVDTVRRDLKILENEGVLTCVHGGAILNEHNNKLYMYEERQIKNVELKEEISNKAIKTICEGDLIFINSGTTNVILAKEIAESCKNITVITNNIEVVNILMKNDKIVTYIAGGAIDQIEKCIYGKQCEEFLNNYFPDKCFLSINAVNRENGFTDFRDNEIPIIKIMQKNARKVYALMDSSKIGKRSKQLVLKLEEVDEIITDKNLSSNKKIEYKKLGIKLSN